MIEKNKESFEIFKTYFSIVYDKGLSIKIKGRSEEKREEAEANRPIVDSDVHEQANKQTTEKVTEQAIEHDELGNDAARKVLKTLLSLNEL